MTSRVEAARGPVNSDGVPSGAALVHGRTVYSDGVPYGGSTHETVGAPSAQFHAARVTHAHVTTLVEDSVHAAVKAYQAATITGRT